MLEAIKQILWGENLKKAIFIYNPLAGDHGIAIKLDYIIQRFHEKDIYIQPYRFFEYKEETLLHFLSQEYFDFVLISGGDGTLNYILNIMLKNNIKLPVGIFPSGTSNDFAHSLGMKLDLDSAIDTILEGDTCDVDVGLINGTNYFFSSCAGGIFVDVSFSTNHELKKNFGHLAYYLKALTEVTNIKPFKLKIENGGNLFEADAMLFIILNGTRAAGFSNLVKEADIRDGMMDILIVKDCSNIELAGLFFKVLSSGAYNDDDKNIVKLKTKSCRIKSSRKIQLSIDGEAGPTLPIEVSFVNRALSIFVKKLC